MEKLCFMTTFSYANNQKKERGYEKNQYWIIGSNRPFCISCR